MNHKIPEKCRKDIEIAANFLKNEGCESVYLFGSLVTGKINDNSDIDIGVPDGKYSRLYFDFDNKIDLIDFELNAGRSSQSTLLGKIEIAYESLYISNDLYQNYSILNKRTENELFTRVS